MTARHRLALAPVVTAAVFGLLTIVAYYAGSRADTGDPPAIVAIDAGPIDASPLPVIVPPALPDPAPPVVTVPPPWYRDGVVITSGVVLAAYGLIALIQAIGRTRWKWTAWLRVGRVQAHIAGAAGALSVIAPAASSSTLRPGAALVALSSWILARNMPGGGEAKPPKAPAVATIGGAP